VKERGDREERRENGKRGWRRGTKGGHVQGFGTSRVVARSTKLMT
jgi:hypothetical protein